MFHQILGWSFSFSSRALSLDWVFLSIVFGKRMCMLLEGWLIDETGKAMRMP